MELVQTARGVFNTVTDKIDFKLLLEIFYFQVRLRGKRVCSALGLRMGFNARRAFQFDFRNIPRDIQVSFDVNSLINAR